MCQREKNRSFFYGAFLYVGPGAALLLGCQNRPSRLSTPTRAEKATQKQVPYVPTILCGCWTWILTFPMSFCLWRAKVPQTLLDAKGNKTNTSNQQAAALRGWSSSWRGCYHCDFLPKGGPCCLPLGRDVPYQPGAALRRKEGLMNNHIRTMHVPGTPYTQYSS